MRRPSAKAQIEQLRRYRVRPIPDTSIAADVAFMRTQFARQQKRASGFETIWAELVPPALATCTRVDRYTRTGVLVVRVVDSAARFQTTQWLAGGGLEALRARAPSTLKLVQLKL